MAANESEAGAMSGLWYVGVGLQIISTMSGTCGKLLIRLSSMKEKTNPTASRIMLKLGLLFNMAIGPLIDVAAYSFAPQSLVAPFGGLDVVWNALVAPYVVNEKLTRHRALGSFLVMLGSVGSAIFGSREEPLYTIEYIEDTLVNLRVLIYFIVFFIWFLFNRFVLLKRPDGSVLKGLSLGWTAGTLAGNMWCTKLAIELIQTSIVQRDAEPWKTWIPYVSLVGAAFFAIVNAIYLTEGLQKYEAFFMITIMEGSMILSASISGAVVLLDVRGLEAYRIVCYSLSVLIVICGMFTIFNEEARKKSSLLSGTASVAGVPDKSSPLQSPKAAMATPNQRSLHATLTLPSTPTMEEARDRSTIEEGLSGKLRSISWQDVESGQVTFSAPKLEEDEVCITLDAAPVSKKTQQHAAAAVIGASQDSCATESPPLTGVSEPRPASLRTDLISL